MASYTKGNSFPGQRELGSEEGRQETFNGGFHEVVCCVMYNLIPSNLTPSPTKISSKTDSVRQCLVGWFSLVRDLSV